MKLAHKTGHWEAETASLRDLSELSYYRNDTTLSLAFIDEVLRRDPNGCEKQRFAHELRAKAYFIAHRFEDSRREILKAPLCNQPRNLTSLILLASLDRMGLPAESPAQLREGLAALRHQGRLTPGDVAKAEYVEGLLMAQHDPQGSRAHFRKAIDLADQLPSWDGDARNARLYSYEVLIMAAAEAGDTEGAWVLLAEERRISTPRQCALGALIADERSLVLMRDAGGLVRLRYEAHRSSPDIDVANLVPEDFKAALQGCTQVAVYAHPLLEGRAALLPPQLTWSFLEPHAANAASKICPYHPLLVTGVSVPGGFGLPPLDPWDHATWTRGYRVLQGPAATPSAALREMHQATEIIVNTYGSEFGGMMGAVLSPGEDKKYLMTPIDLLREGLACAPFVLWIEGDPGGAAPSQNDLWNLSAAAVTAGARASFDVRGPIPKDEGQQFFGNVFERIDAGTTPAAALHDVRMFWIEEKKSEWVKNVALFE